MLDMANAIISDLTGKTIPKDSAYKVSIYSNSTKAHIDFDAEFVEEIKHIVALAVQNGAKWYQLQKTTDGKWERRYGV